MRIILLTFIVMLFFVSTIVSQTTPVYGIRSNTPDMKAIINAKIIVSPTETIEKGSILFENGRIIDVGTELPLPENTYTVDLEGYTVYAGFIDPYTDYGLANPYPQGRKSRAIKFKGTRQGGNACNDAIHAEMDWVTHFKVNTKQSDKYFKNGFTVVQSALKDGIFSGRSFVTLLGKGMPNDLILSPFNSHYLSFDKGSSEQANPSSLMGSITLIRQTFYDLQWYQKAHLSFEKNKYQPRPEFNTAITALSGFGDGTYLFECRDELSLLRADKIAREFDLDFVYVGSGYEYSVLENIKELGATLIMPVKLPKAPDVKTFEDELDIKLSELRHWEYAPFNAYLLDSAGVKFAFTMHGLKDSKQFLGNIRKFIKHGLSKQTALAALTTVPASICNVSNECGKIEKGKLANFIVTNGDIFNDKTDIFSIWVNGSSNKIKMINKVDYSGTYNLNFNDNLAQLDLKPKGCDSYTGTFLFSGDTLKLKDVAISTGKIQFNITLDTLDMNGVLRFSGLKKESNLKGKVALPSGETFNWEALAVTELESVDADDAPAVEKTDEDSDLTRLSRLTFPNKAFGFEKQPVTENVLVQNATVWTSEAAGILEEHDILIKDGKFFAIGKNLIAPEGFKTIDATGKHITAGIIDPHSHIAIDGGVNECTDAITAETRIGDVLNPESISIYRQLAGGTTTSLLLHGSCNAIGGQSQAIKLRWGATAEELKVKDAPPSIKCALGENVKRSGWGSNFNTRYPQTRMGVETILRDEFQAALEYKNEFEKYNNLSRREKDRTIPPRRDLEIDAVLEILNSERDIHCHSYVQSEILMYMRLAEQYGFKIHCFTHILEGYKVADEMARHGATASSFSDWWAYKFEVYDAIPYNINLMAAKGVISSVNSDNADLARRLNQEAAKSVMYGEGEMSQEEAIKFCTINSAIQMKLDHRIGSIKEGKDADFVIWNNNPLSIYAKTEQTWIEGKKYFDIDDNQVELEKIKNERASLIQKVLGSSAPKSKNYKKDYKPAEIEWHCDDNYDFWRMNHYEE